MKMRYTLPAALMAAFLFAQTADAQTTISALPTATIPTGQEILPIVQSGATKRATAQAIANTANNIASGANLNTPAAVTLTNATGLPLATGVTGTLPIANAPIGTGGHMLPALDGVNTWSAAQTFGPVSASSSNLSYRTTYAPGSRAPLFIWQNPNGSTPAGYNAGQQIFIGDNPVGTPGAGDTVAQTIVVTNGNNRSLLYGQNIVVGLCGSAEGCTPSDYVNGPVTGLETDVYGSATWIPANRAFNPSAGTYVINGHEVYCQGPQYCTSGVSIWSTNSNGSNWWREGIVLNRVANIGLHFDKTAGDTGTPLSVAAIQDDTNSANVLQIGSGTHTNYINAPNLQVTATGNARFGNQGEGLGLTNYLVVGGSSGTSGIELNSGGTIGLYCNATASYGQCLTGASVPLYLGVNNGAQKVAIATTGVVTVPNLMQLTGTTFAALPTCNSSAAGSIAYITDASTAITAWHQAVTAGGGSNKAFVSCNGSGWFAFTY